MQIQTTQHAFNILNQTYLKLNISIHRPYNKLQHTSIQTIKHTLAHISNTAHKTYIHFLQLLRRKRNVTITIATLAILYVVIRN